MVKYVNEVMILFGFQFVQLCKSVGFIQQELVEECDEMY